jgi:hypothetical protein
MYLGNIAELSGKFIRIIRPVSAKEAKIGVEF